MTRGPIHDSFARPIGLDVTASATIKKSPPEPIEELPPETRPDGDAEWIPGYRSWDDERDDFIWISGVWRVAPHNHRWVAGYWTESADGFVYVSGFWSPMDTTDVTYLTNPPETQEAGPTSDSPGDNYFWIPGYWVYRDAD